jgi:hypothetical protein
VWLKPLIVCHAFARPAGIPGAFKRISANFSEEHTENEQSNLTNRPFVLYLRFVTRQYDNTLYSWQAAS